MRAASLLAVIGLCGTAVAADMGLGEVADGWAFSVDGRTAFTYHAEGAAKPFIDPLCTPDGHSVTTARSGQPHHHGLWLTWGPLIVRGTGERIDFWSEGGANATTGEIVRKPGTAAGTCVTPEGAFLSTVNEWQRKSDGLALVIGRREVRLHAPPVRWPRAHLLTISSEQTALQDLVISHESNERVTYYGLCAQMPPDMHRGLVANCHGKRERAGVEGVGARWCAYSTDVRPARGVAVFDHPANPRFPNAWFTLESGFLSTSLVAHEDYALNAGETLRLTHGVLVFDGDLDARLVRKQYRRWLGLLGDE